MHFNFVNPSLAFSRMDFQKKKNGRGKGGGRGGGEPLADPVNQLLTKLRSISEISVLFLFKDRWCNKTMFLSLSLPWMTPCLIWVVV